MEVIVPTPTAVIAPPALAGRRRQVPTLGSAERLRINPWLDPIADPHGVHPCSRYVELYWLGVIGPQTLQVRPVAETFLPTSISLDLGCRHGRIGVKCALVLCDDS